VLDIKPKWLRISLRFDAVAQGLERDLAGAGLHTVCQEACCPNQGECFSRGVATFLILGNICTRDCRFCAVRHGKPLPPEQDEPIRVAEEVARLGLRYAVITSVTRDDLEDGGAGHFAAVIEAVRSRCPGTAVEVLVPDFKGSESALRTVIEASPEVLNHNMETVERLYKAVRPQAVYRRSLELLRLSSSEGLFTKSGLMVGLGETKDEIRATMADLLKTGCRALTIGQYLRPSPAHHPVVQYVEPELFEEYKEMALSMGFEAVASSPLVRSSYMAERLYSSMVRNPYQQG
jgi:lipoic acid synthetase